MGSVYAELHVEDVKNFEERQKSEIKARVLYVDGSTREQNLLFLCSLSVL